ncbi:MAG: hypothetical protein RL417_2518 [Pseudomonadota bacterium]
MNVPGRYREVTRGNMPLERCIERTRTFIDRELSGVTPQILHTCMIADWLGRGLSDSLETRERFIAGFSDVFTRALGSKKV